jgi:hypothetical protein
MWVDNDVPNWFPTLKNFYRKMATGRNCSNVGNQFGTSLSTHISNFDDIRQCWIFAVLWRLATLIMQN